MPTPLLDSPSLTASASTFDDLNAEGCSDASEGDVCINSRSEGDGVGSADVVAEVMARSALT